MIFILQLKVRRLCAAGTKQKILEETALAFKKAKANPNSCFDFVSNRNEYDVMSSDNTIKIRFFYGNVTESNPLLNGTTNPIIKSSFPNN